MWRSVLNMTGGFVEMINLTWEQQERLIVAVFEPEDDCVHNLGPLFGEVERLIEEYIDRDRARAADIRQHD